MFLFPAIYILLFSIAITRIIRGKPEAALLFIIFGLPIYITTLSVATLFELKNWVPLLQGCKELVILLTLTTVLFTLMKKPKFYPIDYLFFAYLLWIFLYVVLPIGEYGLKDKMIAMKNMAFFTAIYFTGRFFDLNKINFSKYFHYMCLVAIPAAILVLWEAFTYTHFQTFTGYSDYLFQFLGQEPSGHHGLTWTFEAENDGPKRFASFFANPLDHAAGTLVCMAAILALATTNSQKLKLSNFLMAAFIASVCSIVFALSRASFASYFLIIYAYVYITKRKQWLNYIHYGGFAIVALALTFISDDIYQFIIGTLNFTNSSSVYHILQWVEGIQAIFTNPFGYGMGAAGRISGFAGENIGGENQLIIIAVQAGVVAMALYVAIYVSITRTALQMARQKKGRARKVAIFIALLKLGMIIPILTAEAESYLYVGYITAFFSGIMINIKYNADGNRNRYTRLEISENRTENNTGRTLPSV